MVMWFLTVLLICYASVAVALPPSYTVVPFGVPLSDFTPTALDRHALAVVGDRLVGGQSRAYRSVTPSLLEDLGLPPGSIATMAHGISGQHVALEARVGRIQHAFRFIVGTGFTPLGTAGIPTLFSAASAVNTQQIVGGYGDAPDGSRIVPLRWDAANVLTILPTLAAIGNGFLHALNDTNDATGSSSAADGLPHMVLWPASGGIQDLHSGPGYSFGFDINDTPETVGELSLPTQTVAVSWRASTGLVQLPPVAGQVSSQARGINNPGLRVGQSYTFGPLVTSPIQRRATIWEGTPPVATDLNTLISAPGWVLEIALQINDAGLILVVGTLNGVPSGALLIPDAPPLRRRFRRSHYHHLWHVWWHAWWRYGVVAKHEYPD